MSIGACVCVTWCSFHDWYDTGRPGEQGACPKCKEIAVEEKEKKEMLKPFMMTWWQMFREALLGE
jgi:hypothetical protein